MKKSWNERRKFAIIPTIVEVEGSKKTKKLIWLESYIKLSIIRDEGKKKKVIKYIPSRI